MAKVRAKRDDDMKPEYDFSDAVRGKSFERYQKMKLKVMLEPDVARVFPDSRAVNEALRVLADAVERTGRRPATTNARPSRRRRAG